MQSVFYVNQRFNSSLSPANQLLVAILSVIVLCALMHVYADLLRSMRPISLQH